MNKSILKSIIVGFITGAITLAIVPFGLGIAFVEFLVPVLLPGQLIFEQISFGSLNFLTLWIANGIVFSVLFLAIFLIRKNVENKRLRILYILLVVLLFLVLTGMLRNLYYFILSSDKSWIFQVGA